MLEHDIATLSARLLAERFLPRHDPMVRRVLTDEFFRQQLDEKLLMLGLVLLENPYADHVSLGLHRDQEDAVFGRQDTWQSNTAGLPRDAIALLVVLWALIILPKRQRQISRRDKTSADQGDMFGAAIPMPSGPDVSLSIAEEALLADFGKQLGGRSRIGINLGLLARLGFIERRNRLLSEGPLLDLLLDYSKLAPRIMDGALGDLIRDKGHVIPSSLHEEEA